MIIKRCLLMFAISSTLGIHVNASGFIVATKTPSPAILQIDEGGATKSTIALQLAALDISLDEVGVIHYVTGAALNKITEAGEEKVVAVAPSGIHWEAILRLPGKGWVIGDSRSHSVWMVEDIGHSIRRLADYTGHKPYIGDLLGLNLLNGEKIILLHVGPRGIPTASLVDLDGAVTKMPLFGQVVNAELTRNPTTRKFEESPLATTGGRLLLDRKRGHYLFADDWSRTYVSIFDLSVSGEVTLLFNVNYDRKQSASAIAAMAFDASGDSLVVAAYGSLRRYSMTGKLLQQIAHSEAFWQPTSIITR